MDQYRRILTEPEDFWSEKVKLVSWSQAPSWVLDSDSPPFVPLFPDGRLNTCFNALDRHIAAGNGGRLALIFDSPGTGAKQRFTYADLHERVSGFAAVLRRLGVRKGDAIVIYLPIIPEAVIAMLACARIGATHSFLVGDVAPREIAARIDDAKPKLVLSASCGIELPHVVPYKPRLDQAIELAAHTPDFCVIKQRHEASADLLNSRDLDWDFVVDSGVAGYADCVDVEAPDALYIVNDPGPGGPSGLVCDNGGHAVTLAWAMRDVFDIGTGDVWWATADVGCVVGQPYIVYAPLLAGATTLLCEGSAIGAPDDAVGLWRVVAEYGVTGLFTTPGALRAIRRAAPDASLLDGHDLSTLKRISLAGERLDPETSRWAANVLGVPIVNAWARTETRVRVPLHMLTSATV
ncbi:AMP-binding protein [Streptomyces sp. NPDC051976]|uniref:AMP-binding protein n=1 Tax=Streptomyces sp. NPDC051976 TaxID=3154947 RepID=UPI0034447CC2